MITNTLINTASRALSQSVLEKRDASDSERSPSRASADERDKQESGNHEWEINPIFPPSYGVPSNHTSIIPTSESSEDNVGDNPIPPPPPPRPAEAFLDLECWFEHGCKPSNSEYMDWLGKCVDNEYAFICLLECWQGRGRFQQDQWKVAIMENGRHTIETLDENEYEEARDRAYSMLHGWLQENGDCTVAWHVVEKALPLFRWCLKETQELDRLYPHHDVSREKVAMCRKEVWATYEEESRQVKDLVGDELLLMLIVYELLQDLKRDEEDESETECESSDESIPMHYAISKEEAFHDNKVLLLSHYESIDSPNFVHDDSDEATSSTNDSYCVSAISTRVPYQGRGARFKAIILMDILLSNTISERWEPDLDVDLLKMTVKAIAAYTDSTAMNRKVVISAILKVLSYWACHPGDFDEDHWEIFRLEILPALQALKEKCPEDPLSGGVLQDQERPKKRARRATRSVQGPNDPNHLRHLRSETAAALSKLKECALSFPVVPPNGGGTSSDLTNCIKTLTWMLDEKCIAWMMDSGWRPEMTV